MVAVDRIIRLIMILHMSRSTSSTSTAARRAAVVGVLDELNGAVRLIRCAATGRLVKQGVSMTHLHVMWRLEESGVLPMSRLAEFLDVSLSNATGLIDRMEENGLVERVRVPDDRRLVVVRPAAAGVRAINETESSKRDRLRSVIGRLSPAERQVALSALRSLRRALSAETESSDLHHHHFAESIN